MRHAIILDATMRMSIPEFIGYLQIVLENDIPRECWDSTDFSIATSGEFAYFCGWQITWDDDPLVPTVNLPPRSAVRMIQDNPLDLPAPEPLSDADRARLAAMAAPQYTLDAPAIPASQRGSVTGRTERLREIDEALAMIEQHASESGPQVGAPGSGSSGINPMALHHQVRRLAASVRRLLREVAT